MNKLYIVLLSILLASCGSYQTTTQSDEIAYLQFIGDPQLETLTIDGKLSGTLGSDLESFDLNGNTATRIQILPGKHEFTLSKSGEVIMHRKIYVSGGNVFEVILP